MINLCCLQSAIADLDTQLNETKTQLAAQEKETQKVESKLQASVSEIEKLKTNLSVEKDAWANEKTALIHRAEKTEAALETVTAELIGLRNCVSHMVSTIFGKSYC